MNCPFNICCHLYSFSLCFELLGSLSHRLRLGPMAKPSAVTFLHCSLSHDWNLCILSKGLSRLLYICLSTGIHKLLLTICPLSISNQNSQSRYIKKLVKHGRILSYFFFTPSFLLVSIELTVINNFSALLFDIRVGPINPGTLGAALTSRSTGYSGSSMPLSCSISDSTSAAQSSSLSFELSKSLFQLSQSSVSEMLSGAQSSLHSTGWRLILRIRQTINTWVRTVGWSLRTKLVAKEIFRTIWM